MHLYVLLQSAFPGKAFAPLLAVIWPIFKELDKLAVML